MRKIFLFLIVVSLFCAATLAQKKTSVNSSPQPAAPKVELSDDGVPVLIKHLPDWETARARATVATNLPELQSAAGNRPILELTDFTGGTEAVAANYDAGKLVVIEYQTPQAAIDADARIKANLNNSPQTIYRKIGNYTVFVFDAQNEASANSLIDKVTYEKAIQWLGDNPFIWKQLTREYSVTSGEIIMTTVKAAGFAVVAALFFGGFFGAFIFYRRRREQTQANIFSDAGGMMRLNLDEMTAQTDPSRLIEGK